MLILTVLTCLVRYKTLDRGSRLMFYLIIFGLLSESLAVSEEFSSYKSPAYHVYNVIEIVLITKYFLYTINNKNRAIFVLLCLLYIGVEIGNDLLYQPIRKFNSNFIIFECLLIIPMALYSLYRIQLNDGIEQISRYVHFWFWTCLLLFFSSSFFFWPFVVYFYKHNQLYYNISSYTHLIMNLIVYTGMFITFLNYPKMIRNEY